MKCRRIGQSRIYYTGSFNMSSLTEILITANDGEMWSDYARDYEVLLPNGEWKPLGQAFTDHDVVPNNVNSSFGPPIDDECRTRGWNP